MVLASEGAALPGVPGRSQLVRRTRMYSLTRVIGVLGATALVAACSKGDNKTDSTAAADSTARANAAAPAATQPAAATPAPLNDANIFALMDEANAADSTSGDMASKNGTAASVKSFGRDMMRDH